jgi:RNA polymerase sigma-54 factor
MRFETSQSLKLGQSMKLAPRMIQSMEILQMPLAELEERLAQELENNPTLELRDGDGEPVVEVPVEDASADVETAPLRVDEQHGEADFERWTATGRPPDIAENEFDEPQSREFDDGAMVPASAPTRAATPNGCFRPDARPQCQPRGQLRGPVGLCDVDKKLRPLGRLILQFIGRWLLRTPSRRSPTAPVAPVNARSMASRRRGAGQKPVTADLTRPPGPPASSRPAGLRTPGECLLLQWTALEDEGQSLGWRRRSRPHAR